MGITVHKVEDLSLNAGVISFDLERQRSFIQGQMYVALDRVRYIKNVHLVRTCNCNVFQVNSNVTLEYNRLREISYFVPLNTVNEKNNCSTVSLLNTRSLRRHTQDITKDESLSEIDASCLTKIQICQGNNVPDVKQQLNTYESYLNLEGDRYQNIGFCLSKCIKIDKRENLPGVTILETIEDSFCTNIIRILLLYCGSISSLTIFYNRLLLFLSTCEVFDIVLGDFNITALANGNDLRNKLSEYQLLNRELTHISEFPMDHVYIRREAVQNFSLETIQTTVSVYFSDHEAVKFKLRLL